MIYFLCYFIITIIMVHLICTAGSAFIHGSIFPEEKLKTKFLFFMVHCPKQGLIFGEELMTLDHLILFFWGGGMPPFGKCLYRKTILNKVYIYHSCIINYNFEINKILYFSHEILQNSSVKQITILPIKAMKFPTRKKISGRRIWSIVSFSWKKQQAVSKYLP